MKTIWKFDLVSSCAIQIPEGAEILSVDEQQDIIRMWALVDTDKPLVTRHFFIYGTGYTLPAEPLQFIGTVHLYNGTLVFHIWEGLK